jgi:hypothetical protein
VAYGAGLYVAGSTVSLINDTIADNELSGTGAGGGLNIAAGVVTADNTIVALNTEGSGGGAPADDIAGTVAAASAFNLIGTGGAGGLSNGVNGNQVGVADPALSPLGHYGGPTPTIAVLPGSPAIGKGSNTIAGVTVPTTDQRGVVRPATSIDIGAFQDRGFKLALVAGSSPQATTVNTQFPNPLAVTVTSPFGDPVAGGLITFTVAPAKGGASATLSAGTATIAADGQASVTATANGTRGAYAVTASAAGVKKPAQFRLRNVPAAAGSDGATRTAEILAGLLGPNASPADAGTDRVPLGLRPMPVGDDQYTELASGLLTASRTIGAGDPPSGAAPRIGIGLQPASSNRHAGRAEAPRPAPRAEIVLAGRGRGWSLGTSSRLHRQDLARSGPL